jgi:hypothetical protein
MRRYLNRLFRSRPAPGVALDPQPGDARQAASSGSDGRRPLFEGADEIPFAPVPVKRFAPAMPLLAREPASGGCLLSVVVVVYDMPRQALNTVRSLVAPYQRGVSSEQFEIIVVENASARNMDREALAALGPNVVYHLRQESEPTPVHAANFGIEQARGRQVALLIDGARMVTPGLLHYFLAADRLGEAVVVATPSYHLGRKVQQRAMLEGYGEEEEQRLLASVDWPADGYRLFEISCLSRTSMGGIFRPFGESNCLAAPRALLRAIGGFDPRFNETGGGQANLDLYKRLVELEQTQLVVLPGEGSFHQFHGGVTTGQEGAARHQAMVDHFAQYAALRGGAYVPPDKRPIYLGPVPDSAVRFIRNSGNMLMETLREEGYR